MGIRGALKRVAQTTEESDRQQLEEFCAGLGLTRLDALPLRTPVRVAGQVKSLRIVPRAGAPAVEVSVTDGRGSVVAVFLGRGRVRGIMPGRRLVIEGVAMDEGNEHLIYNPAYELLA